MLPVIAENALLALSAAGLWGIGDFSGGMGVKSAGATPRAALRFVLLSHLTSFFVLVLGAYYFRMPLPHGAPLAWGLLAGLTSGFALTAFYIALSQGTMGIAASISGLLAAAIPAAVSAALEGAPGWRHLAGFAVAAGAIWMIGGGASEPARRSAAILAVVAGAGFGLYFVALRYASPAGLVWPMATARIASMTTCGLILLCLGKAGGSAQVTRAILPWVLATALFDTSGNLLFIAATRAGRLDVAAVLASLYPASTILLAAVVLHERPPDDKLLEWLWRWEPSCFWVFSRA